MRAGVRTGEMQCHRIEDVAAPGWVTLDIKGTKIMRLIPGFFARPPKDDRKKTGMLSFGSLP